MHLFMLYFFNIYLYGITKEVGAIIRKDIHNKLKEFTREELCLLNKSELARRFNCDPRTVERYLKLSSGELEREKSTRVYTSLIDDYKLIIIDKVDNYGSTAMAVYKFILKKGYKGKYSTVADFVNKHKKIEDINCNNKLK